MPVHARSTLWLFCIIALLPATPAWAQAEQAPGQAQAVDPPPADESPPAVELPPAPPPPADGKPLPGPKFFDLRYDEDFSYLDGEPGSYQKDFFDPIKYIHLGEDLRLTIGGEFRFRLESQRNFAFGVIGIPTQDTFELYRFMLHFDLRYRKTARFFLQLASMFEEGRRFGPGPLDENYFAFHQAFLDVRPLGDDTPLIVRIGRQELSYGQERFVSPLRWINARRRFDGVKLMWVAPDWQFDVFYVKPVLPIRRTKLDRYNEDYDLYGAYFVYKGIPDHGIDGFFFAQDVTQDFTNPNGNRGDMSRYTLGGRFYGKQFGFDYDAFLAGQWGTWAGDRIEAWAWGIDGGYTFANCPWKPRLGAGFDWASGDSSPRDGKVGTFNQIFPLAHKYLGFIDFFGRQNVQAVNVNLSASPVPKKVTARIAYLAFWLESRKDAIYNVAGLPGRRDPTGSADNRVGQEIDLTLLWRIDRHQTMLAGYSHFFTGAFIENTGPSDDADFFYLQYQFTF